MMGPSPQIGGEKHKKKKAKLIFFKLSKDLSQEGSLDNFSPFFLMIFLTNFKTWTDHNVLCEYSFEPYITF